MRWPALTLTLALAVLPGCRGCAHHGGTSSGNAAASGSASASAAAERGRGEPPTRVQQLVSAEARRDSRVVTPEDLSSRHVMVRRHAARALARIADARAWKLLSRALSDEDPQVVAWAAFGLGRTCQGHVPTTVRALVSRAASLAVQPAQARSGQEPARPLDPVVAIAGALGRCGSGDAERTLRGWLDGPRARAEDAALALGILAARHKRLDDSTVVALLDAASRGDKPLDDALFPISRIGPLSKPVQTRLLAIAGKALTTKGDRLRFAVRALGHAQGAAVEPLSKVLLDTRVAAGVRAGAARQLVKLGTSGQKALALALSKLAPTPETTDARHLVSPDWGPLITTLEALDYPARAARNVLGALAELPIPGNASAALKRRVVRLRCRSAALLAGKASLASRLAGCDPDPGGRIGALAVVEVLDRGKLTGARYRRWKTFAASSDPVVRQAALELVPGHPEIPHPERVLESALGAKQVGTVATAAQVLAAFPDRAAARRSARPVRSSDAGVPAHAAVKPAPGLVKALTRAFDAKRPADAIEVRSALIDAVAALQLLVFKPKLDTYCLSENPTLRRRAEKALRTLGDRGRTCRTFTPLKQAPAELSLDLPRQVKLELQTDAGTLELYLFPELAPVTVARVVELARAGFYDDVSVHRVVPGFVVQFGDPEGDGYGGAGRQPLPDEDSPLVFESMNVGVALAGSDTGSSQLFVTLGPYPHLDGSYPLIGKAAGAWDRLAVGDRVRKVTVAP